MNQYQTNIKFVPIVIRIYLKKYLEFNKKPDLVVNMKIVDHYIGFFRYEDSKTWMKTNLHQVEQDLKDYLGNLNYIDKSTIQIRKIQLPE